MQTEFEKYLNNDMSAEERKLFEQKLADDPVLADQFRSYEGMLDALDTQMLRERIAVATARGGREAPPEKVTFRKWIWLIGTLLLIGVAVLWYVVTQSSGEEVSPQPNTDLPVEQSLPDVREEKTPMEEPTETEPETEKTSPQKKSANPSGRPIAEGPVPEPSNLSGGVRGLDTESNEWAVFVESVWETGFDPQPNDFNDRFTPVANLLKDKNYTDAYVQLYSLERETPENDTLAFLKGYCLLEMKEGAEALNYLAKGSTKNDWPRKIQWYTVLAHLLTGNKDQAIENAAVIAADKDHPFRMQASKIR